MRGPKIAFVSPGTVCEITYRAINHVTFQLDRQKQSIKSIRVPRLKRWFPQKIKQSVNCKF